MNNPFFQPATVLLPGASIDLKKYSVVACDQYTSEPNYWDRVAQTVGETPSTYHMIFPEVYLEQEGFSKRIHTINTQMNRYLEQQILQEHPHCFVYVQRRQRNGMIRQGLIGKIDLEAYDYHADSKSAIRATEGTILDRIPPRVQIREHAPLELPHVMVLIDDPAKRIIEPFAQQCEGWEQLYQFDLMEQSGRLSGWKVADAAAESVMEQLKQLESQEIFEQKYGVLDQPPMVYAMGDGNHSLATAKACYEQLKQTLSPEEAAVHPARYALVELVNLHDDSLVFEAIHRVVFDVDADHLHGYLSQKLDLSQENGQQSFEMVIGNCTTQQFITTPTSHLAVGSLQSVLDEYLHTFGGRIDYIHGVQTVSELCQSGQDRLGFILPAMEKTELFPAILKDGALPRKTFSMGDAWDKRFYLEARKIK